MSPILEQSCPANPVLRGALAGMPSGRRPKKEVDRRLAELGIDGGLRAEALDVEQHLRLCEAFG
jgi:16S rRNA (adenine1518-N6/adenine1519-N6)-dimethyltransferase